MRKMMLGALIAAGAMGLTACSGSSENANNIAENGAENAGELSDSNSADNAFVAGDNVTGLDNGADATLTNEADANLSGNAVDEAGNAQ